MASRKNDDIPGLLQRLVGQSESSAVLVGISILLVCLAVGTYTLWSHFGGYVMGQPEYQLTVESLETTPQPAWIATTDVRDEAARSVNLSSLHIRQSDVTLRVAQAFSMHPWVRKVVHVSKRYPARIIVQLDYRQPVAMVEVSNGWLPIDAEGVLLPTNDFGPEATRQYMRIAAGESQPVSSVAGTSWGDDRVIEAASVAAYLQPYANELKLREIIAYRGKNDIRGRASYDFLVMTEQDTSIIWGHAPSRERSGEPVAEQKLTRLRQFAAEQGSLDVLQPGQTIDLRNAVRLDVAALPEDLK